MSRKVLIEGILFLVIGLLNIAESLRLTLTMRQPGIYDVVGPDRYSFIVGFALVTAAVSYIFSQRKQTSNVKERKSNEEKKEKSGLVKVVGIIGILSLYAILIPTIGYFLASVVFFFLMLKILGLSSWILGIILSVGMTLIYLLIFGYFLGVILPKGFIGL